MNRIVRLAPLLRNLSFAGLGMFNPSVLIGEELHYSKKVNRFWDLLTFITVTPKYLSLAAGSLGGRRYGSRASSSSVIGICHEECLRKVSDAPVRLLIENLMSWTQETHEGIGGVNKGASSKIWSDKLSLRIWRSATLTWHGKQFVYGCKFFYPCHRIISSALIWSLRLSKKDFHPNGRSNIDQTQMTPSYCLTKQVKSQDDNRRTELTVHLHSQPTSLKHQSGLSVFTSFTWCTFGFTRWKSWRQELLGAMYCTRKYRGWKQWWWSKLSKAIYSIWINKIIVRDA